MRQGIVASVMNQVASFFATPATPKQGVSSSASALDPANSAFAALLAQLQGTQHATNIAPVTSTTDATTSKPPGQLISAIAGSTEHIAASTRLHPDTSADAQGVESVSPSELAGQSLAAQQTELAKLIHQALGNRSPEHGPIASSTIGSSSPAPTNTVLDANADIPLQDLESQVPAIEGLNANNPAVAQLIANAAKHNTRQTPPAISGKSDSNNTKLDESTALKGIASALDGGLPSAGSEEAAALGDKRHQSGNSNSGQANTLLANGNAKPVDMNNQALGQTTPASASFTTELEKVQQTYAGGSLLAQVPLDAIAVQIARRFEQGISKFEISLHPADLGKLDISINVADDGRIQAVLRAERSDTLDLLRQDSRALENQLRQAGLDVDSNSLSFQLSQGNDNKRRLTAPDSLQGRANLASGDREEVSAAHYIAVRKRDGVDIHV